MKKERERATPPVMLGGLQPGGRELLFPRAVTDGVASAQLLEAERKEEDELNRISFLFAPETGFRS